MGVDIALMRFFDHCAGKGGVTGPMLALGSLNIQETPEAIRNYATANGYTNLLADGSVASLFRDRYGLERYVSCDINGLADEYVDLGIPLPQNLRGQFQSILNGGTLEHVFDMRQATENIHDALAVGGTVIHTTPTTWFDHGFVNHNPVMHHLVAQANGYEILSEGTYYNLGTFEGQTHPVVSVFQLDERIPGFDKTNREMFTGAAKLPANSMHLIAMRKMSDRPFVIPTQVAY
jgi:SAM-dependent methyltransferase